MTPNFLSGALAAWAVAYTGVGGFFLLAYRWARRETEYLVFGLVSLFMGMASGGVSAIFLYSGSVWSVVGSRVAVTGATLAAACHLHFAMEYAGVGRGRRLLWVSYGAAAAVTIAAWTVGWGQGGFESPPPFFLQRHPALGIAFSTTSCANVLGSLLLLLRGYRASNRETLVILAAFAVVGCAVAHDLVALNVVGRGAEDLIGPHVLWVYVMAMVAALFHRYRGTEGRLRETAFSLRERTEQLRRSHAELEKMHDELVKKEQLAAVGELAASIAHEVRNPLAVIVNANAGLRRKNLPAEDRNTLLSIIDEETERLNRLVAELLRFARPVSAQRSSVSLLELCQQVQRGRPPGHEVVISIPDDTRLNTIYVDPGLLRLVLDNLVDNACQAMKAGGSVLIDVHASALAGGQPAVDIDVSDTGHGMEPSVLHRAKSPFFTTRPSGTGLGLPIVERIVEAHGGEFSLRSEAGEGTTATLRIPLGVTTTSGVASTRRPTVGVEPMSPVATSTNDGEQHAG